SLLEKRFIEALRREQAGLKFKLSELLFKGKAGYLLQAGTRRWKIELQVSLGHDDGVVIPCKPDFVFWPDDGTDDLPIAVFVDGWQYHKDIIAIDLAKRMAVAKSSKFSVWTLVWDDIESALQGKPLTVLAPWSTLVPVESAAMVQKLCDVQGISALGALTAVTPFMQLHRRLADTCYADLRKFAVAAAIGMLMPPGEPFVLNELKGGAFWQRLEELGLLADCSGHRQGSRQLGGVLSIMTSMHPDQLKQIMTGNGSVESEPILIAEWRNSGVPEEELKQRWQQLWQVMNLLLPLRQLWVGTADMPGLPALQDSPALKVGQGGISQAWQAAIEDSAQEVHEWCLLLAQAGIAEPEPGYELLNGKGLVVAATEIAWPSVQVAIFLPDSLDAVDLFAAQGWHCFTADGGELPPELRSLLMETLA
ncbi:helicase, partial [Pseudomonas sp. AF1]|nr:helicase [Pseudomonas sp. AF1]